MSDHPGSKSLVVVVVVVVVVVQLALDLPLTFDGMKIDAARGLLE